MVTESSEGKVYTEKEIAELLARRPPVPRLAFRPREVAEALGVSRTTIDRLICAKKIRTRRIGHRVLIPASELAKLLRQDPFFAPATDQPVSQRFA
jgi:excisionase family DNA binding protein